MTNNKYWKNFKNNLSIVSSIIGIMIPIICFYLLPNVNILLDPLSKFGVAKETWLLWLLFIQITSILLYFSNLNIIKKIKDDITIIQFRTLEIINIISSVSLSFTGFIPMDIKYIHLGFAAIFFLSYTGFIFWWGVFNIKYNMKIAIISIITSMLIIISSFSTLQFGYGIFELSFIILICYWNLKVHK